MVARELKARYRGSVLGLLLVVHQPAAAAARSTRSCSPSCCRTARPDLEPYSLFMFCGILPWTWFSSSLLESSNVLISGGNLIKKVLFPAEVLPIVTVLANMVHFFLGLPILVVFLIYYQRPLELIDLALVPGRRARAARLHARPRAHRVGADRALPRPQGHPVEPDDVLVLRDADHLPDVGWRSAVRRQQALLDLNPFTHLAMSYQEILFFPGAFGHWKWLARPRRRLGGAVPRWATSCSTACGTPSPKKCRIGRRGAITAHIAHDMPSKSSTSPRSTAATRSGSSSPR